LAPGQPGPPLTITPAEAATLPARTAAGQSVLAVHPGQVLDEYQALQALLLASADNIADVLAVDDAGTAAAFVAKMNAAAARLGMAHTRYVDPSGLDPATVSVPADQLLLARTFLDVPVLAAIVAQPSAAVPGVGTITNFNTLVGRDGFTGVKTGSTTPAGGCLVFSVTRTVGSHPYTFTGAVLGQRRGPFIAAALAAAGTLATSAFANVRPRPVAPAGRPVLAVSRADRRGTAVTTAPLQLTGLPGEPVALTVVTTPPPAGRGAPRRWLEARTPTSSGRVPVRTPVLPAPTFGWKIAHLLP
jgi:D-alanyl-D-alanine carboxypeptidase (penicillin-binding protein 5/6)